MGTIYKVSPPVTDRDLNELFSSTWPDHRPGSFANVLSRSLATICAYDDDLLVGFVNLAWDGGVHGFILDTTVAPAFQRRGIGSHLIELAKQIAADNQLEWLHVDFEPRLGQFYRSCGFTPSEAGLYRLRA